MPDAPAQGEQAGNDRRCGHARGRGHRRDHHRAGEYPVTAFLLAPLAAAIVFGRRITTVVAVLATSHGALVRDRRRSLRRRGSGSACSSSSRPASRSSPSPRYASTARRVRYRADAGCAPVGTALPLSRRGDIRHRVDDRRRRPVPRTAPGLGALHRAAWPAYADTGWLEAVHPEDREPFVAAWTAAPPGDTDETTAGSGTPRPPYRYVNARGVPIIEDGEVREWIGTITDVHDRAEALLRAAADAQLRTAVLQSLQDGVFVTASDGRSSTSTTRGPACSDTRAMKCSGRSRPTHGGRPCRAAETANRVRRHDRDRVAVTSTAANSRSRSGTRTATCSARSIAMSAIRDGDQVDLLVGTVKDVTLHAAAEARLRVIAGITASAFVGERVSEIGYAALEELLPQLDCPHGAFFVLDQEPPALCLVAEVGLSIGRVGAVVSPPTRPARAGVDVFHSRETLIIVEQHEFAARYPGLADYVHHLGWHTTMNMPLIKGDAVLGVLFLAFDDAPPAERRRPRTSCTRSARSSLKRSTVPACSNSNGPSPRRCSARCSARSRRAGPTSRVAARYVPAVAELSVGGDWYDVVPLDDDPRRDRRRRHRRSRYQRGGGHGSAAQRTQRGRAHDGLRGRSGRAARPLRARHRRRQGDDVALRHRRSRRGHAALHLGGTPARTVVSPNGTARSWKADGDGRSPSPIPIDRVRKPSPSSPPGSTILLYTDGLVERRNERLEDGLARSRAARRHARTCRSSSCATSCSTSSSAPATRTTSRWLRCA